MEALGEINVVPSSDVYETVSLPTKEQIVQLYEKLYEGTNAQFCRDNDLNLSNFKQVLKGKRGSARIIAVLRCFVLGCAGLDGEIVDKELSIQDAVGLLRDNQECDASGHTPALIFVDGDNATKTLKRLVRGSYGLGETQIFWS